MNVHRRTYIKTHFGIDRFFSRSQASDRGAFTAMPIYSAAFDALRGSLLTASRALLALKSGIYVEFANGDVCRLNDQKCRTSEKR
jgi:hypothetical protein